MLAVLEIVLLWSGGGNENGHLDVFGAGTCNGADAETPHFALSIRVVTPPVNCRATGKQQV